MRTIKRKKGQSTAEYAIIIALVLAAAIAMQTYVKRSLQGGIKFAVDKVKKNDTTATAQYEPYYLESAYDTTVSDYRDTEETQEGGKVIRTIGADNHKRTVTRSGHQEYKDTTGAD